MFVDSHCHLNFPELIDQLPQIRQAMAAAQVDRALCICTTMEEFAAVHGLATRYDNFWATVGVHPDTEHMTEPSVQDLVERAALPRVVAIGETGLDYYGMEDRKGGRSIADLDWQRERFRTHIRAALDMGFHVSFSGIITFKSAQDLRDVAAFVPMDRLLIETDSPYLAPVPYRGKTNNPSYVPFVARQIAAVKGLAVEQVAEATSRNFEQLFLQGAAA